MKLLILKKINKKSYKYLVVSVVALGICVYCSTKQLNFTEVNVILPIKKFIHECIDLPNTINTIIHMQETNKKLQNQVIDLNKQLQLLKQQHSLCNKFNTNTKKKLNVLETNNLEQVLGFEQGLFNSSLIISLSNSQDKNGYIVVTTDGLVGIITNVAKNIGLVRTITDSRLCIPVKTKNGITLVIRGTNSNELVSVAIKQHGKLNINIGDILYTSGEGGMFPPNIPVAKVIAIDLDKHEIKACPVVDIPNITLVNLRKSVKIMLDFTD